MRLLFLVGSAAAAAILSSSGQPITIGLTRLRRALKVPRSLPHRRDVPLGSDADIIYFGNGTVRNQTFQFLFDTGSSDVVVPDPQCPYGQCGPGERYDRAGQDLNRTATLHYATGTVLGDMFEDAVTVDGHTARNQVLVSAYINQLTEQSDANGVIGLAFPAAASTNSTTFLDNLMQQHAIATPEIGIYYGRVEAGPGHEGELTVGGRNPKRFEGAVTELPVIDEFYWTVKLDQVLVNGKRAGSATVNNQGASRSAIDSGAQSMLAPRAAAAAVYGAIPGARLATPAGNASNGFDSYLLPCNTTQAYIPTLVMGGRAFDIPASEFLGGPSSEFPDLCDGALLGVDQGRAKTPNLWTIGDVFLRSWYSIYSRSGANGKPMVGLARAKP